MNLYEEQNNFVRFDQSTINCMYMCFQIREVLLYTPLPSRSPDEPSLQAVSNLLQPLLSSLPVDNVPDGREVLGLAVLVLKVVCVLPGVNAEDGTELADHGVLVGVGLDANVAGLHVLHQPGPAGALDAGEGGVELALQLLERAVGVVDLLGESAGWGLAAALGLGCEVLPEESVVDVSA